MNSGSVGPVRCWLDRLLETALVLVAIGMLLNWAWQLIRPLIPVLLVMTGLSAVITVIVRRHRSW